MKAKEFDKRFDRGEDISHQLIMAKASRPGDKKINLPPIDYKALAEDSDAAKQERKGINTGCFTATLYVDLAVPQEAKKARRKTGLS